MTNGGDILSTIRRIPKMLTTRRKGGGMNWGLKVWVTGIIVFVIVLWAFGWVVGWGLGMSEGWDRGMGAFRGVGKGDVGEGSWGERMRIVVVVNRREKVAVGNTLSSLGNGWGIGRKGLMGVVDLEVWLFRNASTRALAVSEGFRWVWGEKKVRTVPGDVAMYEMWLSTGWGNGLEEVGGGGGRVPTLFVEAGTELAGGWQRWLREAGSKYWKRMDIAGFTLDGVRVRRRGPGGVWTPLKVSPDTHPAFLYRLTDGIATYMPNWNPNSDVWAAFREYMMIRKADWHRFPELNDRDTPLAPDSPSMNYTMAHWTAWLTKFQAEFRLYTLYPNLQEEKTFAMNPFVPKAHHLSIRDDEFTVLQQSDASVTLPRYSELKRIETDGKLVVRHTTKHLEEIERYASSSSGEKLISFTMVNRVFLETARSWLCNVDVPNMRPPNIVWVTTDQDTHRALSDIDDTLSVFLGPDSGSKDGSGLEFGNPGYWKMMLDRTKLISDILDRGIALFNFETDAIWLADALQHTKRLVGSGADIVGTINTRNEISGNFFYLKPTLPTRHLWHEIAVSFQAAYDKAKLDTKAADSRTYIENDQSILTKLVLRNETWRMSYPLAFLTLDTQRFADGRWYMPEEGWYQKGREKAVIVQNNFVIGVQKKMERAKKWKHWFWKSAEHKCDEALVNAAVGLPARRVDLGHL